MRGILAAALLLCGSGSGIAATVPWVNNGSQSIIGFDNIAPGTTSFISGGIDTLVSGGTVVAGTVANPAQSGTQVYGGTSIFITVGPADHDLRDYCWPDFSALVTGSAAVLLELYAYDYGAGMEAVVFTRSLAAGSFGDVLSYGATNMNYGLFTSARFSSDSYFTIDALTLGLPDVAPGVPEPGTWALLIAGFAGVGGALRRRRLAGPPALA